MKDRPPRWLEKLVVWTLLPFVAVLFFWADRHDRRHNLDET